MAKVAGVRKTVTAWEASWLAMSPPARTAELVRSAQVGCGPLSCLTSDQLASLVALASPMGPEARDAFFRKLRKTADRLYPTSR